MGFRNNILDAFQEAKQNAALAEDFIKHTAPESWTPEQCSEFLMHVAKAQAYLAEVMCIAINEYAP